MEKMNQEFLFKLSMFEQQIQQIQQQLQAVEEGISDMNMLNLSLDEIKKSVGKEALAPLGRGIFVETKILSDKLTVDVGGKNFVRKSVEETREIIDEQTKKLDKIKRELDEKLEEINENLTEAIMESQEQKDG